MERREWLQRLRGAVHSGDGVGVVGLLLADREPLPVWQLIGDGLAIVLAQQPDGTGQLAADRLSALHRRVAGGPQSEPSTRDHL